MAAFNKFNDFTEQKNRGVHNLGTHVFKVALTNTAPVAANTTWNVTDHPAPAAVNGYSAGGGTTTVSIAEVAGVTTVQGTQVVFTATAGGIGPYRYAVLYNDSATSPLKAAIAWADKGASESLASGEALTVQFGGATPGTIFTDT